MVLICVGQPCPAPGIGQLLGDPQLIHSGFLTLNAPQARLPPEVTEKSSVGHLGSYLDSREGRASLTERRPAQGRVKPRFGPSRLWWDL